VSGEQEALRDMWLAELWKPCPEWHQTKDERQDAHARNDALAESRGEPELPLGTVA